MTVKAWDGSVWNPVVIGEAVETGFIESIIESAALELNGGILADITVTEAADVTPSATPTGTPSVVLIPPPVLLSGNNITSGSTATTRPVGTVSGDRLYLVVVYLNTQVAAQVITGWTIESGIDSLPATHKSTIYSRSGGADLTATDTPTLTTTPTSGAWMMVAIHGTTGVDVAVVKATGTLATIPTTSITTIADKTLIVHIVMTGTNVSVTATGAAAPWVMSWIDMAAAVIAIMTRVVDGISGPAQVWPAGADNITISSSSAYIVYSFALTF